MIYKAEINIMPLKELLDPQGKAVIGGLKNLHFTTIKDVRIGKHITLDVEASTPDEAKSIANEACKKLLANAVMESFEITVAVAN